ncbi:Pre-mRNA-splicing factor of RES complex-domain-containing protein [Hygrophoropsis aurantiaca]|uniref:Pre-mRNA-splicing factor of RES complex-domain-containing protein n=1 Tax=Hygrophoropsis aurantiaca TaxID=72124 RepID=A0ACB8ATJ3_9AGAM|nr:Pre-mRNA-splicing factor of RES complex-domain-containing protein [Hygrophoropsis aurantiaca]
MQAYLAEKYMSGPKADAILSRTAPKKKKKRKAETQAKSMFVDEDAGWGDERREEEDEMEDAVVAKDRSFKKRRVVPAEEDSGWATVREGVKEETPPIPMDEQPLVVDEPSQPFVGGLLTGDQLRKALPKPVVKAEPLSREEEEAAQETVYRDASGRKIDTKAARAEAARKKREREEKEAQKMEWGKGLVQKEEAAKLKKQLEKNKTLPFARTADDQELNEEQKAKDRWNDPAAAFLTKKTAKGPRKPQYTGPPPPPNRFGIKPGYRWDGVDRGNGFEKKFFQRQNERKRTTAAGYEWSVDDM